MAPPSPSKNFLRVVAVGVQGLLNSQPQKSAEWLLKLHEGFATFPILCVNGVEYHEPAKKLIVETVYFEKVKIPSLRATTRDSTTFSM